jgi:hypothetical protein
MRTLCLSTFKSGKQVVTNMSVFVISDDGKSKVTMIFQDYAKSIKKPCARATENLLLEHHNESLSKIDDILKDVYSFYGKTYAQAA